MLQIYPSEFGAKRMKEEELKGPTELVTSKPDVPIGNGISTLVLCNVLKGQQHVTFYQFCLNIKVKI